MKFKVRKKRFKKCSKHMQIHVGAIKMKSIND